MSADAAKPTLADKIQRFDRRWIFLAMGLAIVIPLFFFPIGLPVKSGPMVKAAFNAVESLKEGDVVFMSLDLDPASTPELDPFYRAVLLQLKRKNVKIVIATVWYAAPPLVERWIRESVENPVAATKSDRYAGIPDRAYKRNVDYVYLGFRDGKEVAISALGNDLRKLFDNRAADGTSLDDIPMMEGKKQLKDFDLLVLISAGFPGAKEYVQYVQARYKLPMIAACTAVSTTDLSPYFQTGQLLGLVGGLSSVAEFENMVGRKGTALEGTDVLNVGHGVVILAIIFGNIIFFTGRRRRRGTA